METPNLPAIRALRPAWNKGRIVGQKRPLKPKHVWTIRVRLELAENHRDLALFNMAIDSKLRGCDLVKMKVVDVMASGQIKERASVLQSKTQKPARFEISEGTRASVEKWMEDELMVGSEYLWPGRFHERLHISTRQYARVVRDWVTSIGFDTVLTGLGIVSTRWQLETPMIFKSMETQAHGRRATFVPGFGCSLADAIEASCSAYPFFEIKTLETASGDVVELFDGGYCANNPSLYALADATVALGYAPENCRLLPLGCGQYPEPKRGFIARRINTFLPVQLLQKTLEVNTASMDQLRRLLYSNVPTVRISDTFDKPEMATDMFEHDPKKLNLLRQQGAESFARREVEVRKLLLEKV
ncbi:hypothetical protein So717_00480 [Roseobacter cerasinus]|uniref:Uncharacterized protein n=1 Tax=Roseobacter cerasinus TaxID=2602289 RepID=A0A640VN58_9RHOB|nr:hypothetical protein So717_00480 [Roseobacter cerasinus]